MVYLFAIRKVYNIVYKEKRIAIAKKEDSMN